MHINPFTIDTAKIEATRIVDRSSEIEALRKKVIEWQQNVLVIGDYGIGKTCLLKKFRHQHVTGQAGLLVLELQMQWITREDQFGFLREINKRIVLAACKVVTGHPFEDLEDRLRNSPTVPDLIKKEARWFWDIYFRLRSDSLSFSYERSTEAGAALIASGKLSEKSSKGLIVGPLKGSDHLDISRQLLQLLPKYGVSRLIAFGDEANHMNEALEVDVLQSYLEDFAGLNLQFVFTARPGFLERANQLAECFTERVNLTPFESSAAINDLLEVNSVAQGNPLNKGSLSDDCIALIWLVSNGSPKHIQRILAACCDLLLEKCKQSLTPSEVVAVISSLYDVRIELR